MAKNAAGYDIPNEDRPGKIVAFFVRHGETDLNSPPNGEAEKFRGDIDAPLNETGMSQAEELPSYLKGYRVSALYHTGMHRTAQTLLPFADERDMEMIELPAFNSLDTGDFAGLPKNDENKERMAYYRDNPEEQIPGGESVQEFRDRVDPIIMNLIRMGEEGGAPVVAVAHGSVMREISRLFDTSYDSLKIEPGGVVGVFKSADGYYVKPLVKEDDEQEDMDKPGS